MPGRQVANVKLDIGKAFLMRYENHLTFREIAEKFGCSPQYVHESLQRFEGLIPNGRELATYETNRPKILSAIESELLSDLADKPRRQKASLNNTAYALRQVYDIRRLETGKATSNVLLGASIITELENE